MGQSPAPRETSLRALAPVIDLRESDEWRDALQPITLRDFAASRGARFLTVVVVTLFLVLIAAVVLLWQRVEEGPTVTTTEPAVNAVAQPDLIPLKNRLNSLETRLGSFLDETQTVVTSPPPSQLEYEIAVFRACLVEFQHAIAAGGLRCGQFKYC